jgi:serine/threonine-protein kinase
VKVLDFGLAKALTPELARGDPESSPTLTMRATMAGMIMGTAGYMSPEQAKGNPVDRRADIWAFGVVLYEILTGERPFVGDSATELLGAVIHQKPDLDRAPLRVRRLLGKCLEKDPKHRLQAIGDWRLLLDEATAVTVLSWPRRTWIMGVAAGAVLGALATAAAMWTRPHTAPEPHSVTRSAMYLPTYAYLASLSRDGTRLVWTQVASDSQQINLRMMDQMDGKPVPGADPGLFAVFSPDGQWILYFSVPAPYKWKKIPVTGGEPVTVAEMPPSVGPPPPPALWSGADWGLDDTILWGSQEGLMRVPAAGGTPQSLTKVNRNKGESMHSWPQFLPGGRAAVFTIVSGNSFDSARVALVDLQTGAYHVVVNAGYRGRYVPSGHLVYTRGSTLYAIPFDLKRLTVTGPEMPVAEGLYSSDYTFSDSSLLVFNARAFGAEKPLAKLEWTDRNGVTQPLSVPPQRWGAIAVSPDGKRLAGSIKGESADRRSDIWIYDLERRTLTRLTFDGTNIQPVWTPDGRWVTYSYYYGEGKHGIYRVAADKSSQPELLLAAEFAFPSSWTPDGKALLYIQSSSDKRHSGILSTAGNGVENRPRLLSPTSNNETDPLLSADGKWVAYDSDESGQYEIYVEPFPGPGAKTPISTQGGRGLGWSRNGRELFYVEPNTWQVMAVDMTKGPQIHAGSPKALFKLPVTSWDDVIFDVTPDPNRFLVGRAQQDTGTTFVTITNWFDDLRRRAPANR